MIREIVLYGNPVLRQKGARVSEISEAIKQLAADMLDTMREAHGVGLAAQQVGVPLQMAVIDVRDIEDRPSTMSVDGQEVEVAKWMPLVLLNPVLELGKEKLAGPEGCLSFPEMTAEISRALQVVIRAQLLDGRHVQFAATGLLARALQHEFDHLQGVLFIDRMSSAAKASLAGKLKRLQKEAGSR